MYENERLGQENKKLKLDNEYQYQVNRSLSGQIEMLKQQIEFLEAQNALLLKNMSALDLMKPRVFLIDKSDELIMEVGKND